MLLLIIVDCLCLVLLGYMWGDYRRFRRVIKAHKAIMAAIDGRYESCQSPEITSTDHRRLLNECDGLLVASTIVLKAL